MRIKRMRCLLLLWLKKKQGRWHVAKYPRLNRPIFRVVINYHWELSLPNAPGRSKLWKEASPEAEGKGAMATRRPSLRGVRMVERSTCV